jgi:hypothetical protein
MLGVSLICTGVHGALQEHTYSTYGPCWRESVFYTVRSKYFTSTSIIHDSLFSKINKIIAYAFAAHVRVHAEERATRFRRLGTLGKEELRTWRCRHDELEGHGRPPVHDSRLQLDLSAHLRIWRQSAVFGTFSIFGFFFQPFIPARRALLLAPPIFHHFVVARDYPGTCLGCTLRVPSKI